MYYLENKEREERSAIAIHTLGKTRLALWSLGVD